MAAKSKSKSSSKKPATKPAKRSSDELSSDDLDKVTGGAGAPARVGDKGDNRGRVIGTRIGDKGDKATNLPGQVTIGKKKS